MIPTNDRQERLEELLLDRSTSVLSATEQTELELLLRRFPNVDADMYDHAATIAMLAILPRAEDIEPMPERLRTRIHSDARAWFNEAGIHEPKRTIAPIQDRPETKDAAFGLPIWSGWLAAVACLVLAIVGWSGRTPLDDIRVTPGIEIAGSPEQQRQALIEQASDAIELAWAHTEDPLSESVSGDLIWSNSQQLGIMRFRGLEMNDPSLNQYQLWIFDANQDERYPIDGGVFDIDSDTGEVLVAVDPKIAVVQPTLFAVTLEKPGGVVVSSRERLVLLAQVGD